MDKMYRVMFRSPDMKKAMGLGSDGHIVNKKLFMCMFEKDKAEKVAAEIRTDFPEALVTVAPF